MAAPAAGGLVISLDFELHWGVRDRFPADGAYRAHLLGARRAVPLLLALFREFGIAATWATVGILFARTRAEVERFAPALRPGYADPALRPYGEEIGEREEDDPLHLAGSLVEQVRDTPGQELGTHTWSHYYCLEAGQDAAAFRADLAAAQAIAAARGVRLRSIVFPRNQRNPAYDGVLRELGIVCYRGNAPGWAHRSRPQRRQTLPLRLLRGAGDLVAAPASLLVSWERVRGQGGLHDVPASLFLRPVTPRAAWLDRYRLARIQRGVELAAQRGALLHLWWHPHNFGVNTEQNLAFLRRVLETFARCRESLGMRSLSMAGAAAAAGEA